MSTFPIASAHVIASVLKRIFGLDRKSTRLNSSHVRISYAVFCLKKKSVDVDTVVDTDTHAQRDYRQGCYLDTDPGHRHDRLTQNGGPAPRNSATGLRTNGVYGEA